MMLDEFVGQKVVIDFRSDYVCLGTLKRYNDYFLEVHRADLHDLRDTDTNRESYVVDSVKTGINRNRKRVVVNRTEVVAIALLTDVVTE